MFDCTPDTELIFSLRNRSINWKSVLGELIDNSFDASAQSVDVDFTAETLKVRDDGHGCGDVRQMLVLGKHCKNSGTQLGRYGVGLKNVSLHIAKNLTIESRTDAGINTRLDVDWEKLRRSGRWESDDPYEPVKPNIKKPGVLLQFTSLQKRPPHKADFDKLKDEIAFTYSPAIRLGKAIRIQRTGHGRSTLKAFTPPQIERVVDVTVNVGGKMARIVAGVVQDGQRNPRPGFHIIHAYRVIRSGGIATSDGRHHSMARIYGEVHLDGKWSLSDHKDGLSRGFEDLSDAVAESCEDILSTASERVRSIAIDGLTGRAEQLVTKALRMDDEGDDHEARTDGGCSDDTKKPKRHRKDSEKSDRPNSSSDVDGDIKRRIRRGGFHIDVTHESDEDVIGYADIETVTVHMNPLNGYVKTVMESENALWLAAEAASVFVNEVFQRNVRDRFPLFADDMESNKARSAIINKMYRYLRDADEEGSA